jgi:hypothetical protein
LTREAKRRRGEKKEKIDRRDGETVRRNSVTFHAENALPHCLTVSVVNLSSSVPLR